VTGHARSRAAADTLVAARTGHVPTV
jgi:hypothetical protein